jgi:phage replication-related protein YjqB (UPF0714/DUF867 family)
MRMNCSTVVIAPHGGGIEPGTSEIATRIAADDLAVALFEDLKPKANIDLHMASIHFDEPSCLALVQKARNVIAVSGEASNGQAVYLDGADTKLGAFLLNRLNSHRSGPEKTIYNQNQS